MFRGAFTSVVDICVAGDVVGGAVVVVVDVDVVDVAGVSVVPRRTTC